MSPQVAAYLDNVILTGCRPTDEFMQTKNIAWDNKMISMAYSQQKLIWMQLNVHLHLIT